MALWVVGGLDGCSMVSGVWIDGGRREVLLLGGRSRGSLWRERWSVRLLSAIGRRWAAGGAWGGGTAWVFQDDGEEEGGVEGAVQGWERWDTRGGGFHVRG